MSSTERRGKREGEEAWEHPKEASVLLLADTVGTVDTTSLPWLFPHLLSAVTIQLPGCENSLRPRASAHWRPISAGRCLAWEGDISAQETPSWVQQKKIKIPGQRTSLPSQHGAGLQISIQATLIWGRHQHQLFLHLLFLWGTRWFALEIRNLKRETKKSSLSLSINLLILLFCTCQTTTKLHLSNWFENVKVGVTFHALPKTASSPHYFNSPKHAEHRAKLFTHTTSFSPPNNS